MSAHKNHDKTIRMANQIASFFHSKPEKEGVEGIADHINKFWEKRMRADLFEVLENNPQAFDEWVAKAASSIRKPS